MVALMAMAIPGIVLCGISGASAAAPLKVCIVSGSGEYESSEFLPQYGEYLEDRYNVEATVLQSNCVGKEPGDSVPGLEALETCDVALIYTRRLEIDGEQLRRFKKYCLSGKPLVAVRTASHGFQNFLELDKEVLGGNYHGHFGGGARGALTAPTKRAELAEGAADHPIMHGVKRIKSRYSLYKTGPVADDVQVLLWAEIPGEEKQAAAWVREYKGGRVFYTELGGWQDFENDTFRHMIAQALYWTARRDVEAKPLPLPARRTKPTGTFTVPLRSRVQAFKSREEWQEVDFERELEIAESAIVICDMWDRHWCQGATDRVGDIARKMNPLLRAARAKGIQIVHCPSECIDYYADWPQRRRVLLAQAAEPPRIELPRPPLPIDDSDGGCDSGQKPWYMAWTKQHGDLEIGEFDGISDNGDEVYNFFAQEGIKNILMMGVHTNMCVLGRGFAIRPMTERRINCILVRDLTDAMYNPEKSPYVSHAEGTELVIQYIEKHYAPSTTSEGLMEAFQ